MRVQFIHELSKKFLTTERTDVKQDNITFGLYATFTSELKRQGMELLMLKCSKKSIKPFATVDLQLRMFSSAFLHSFQKPFDFGFFLTCIEMPVFLGFCSVF